MRLMSLNIKLETKHVFLVLPYLMNNLWNSNKIFIVCKFDIKYYLIRFLIKMLQKIAVKKI